MIIRNLASRIAFPFICIGFCEFGYSQDPSQEDPQLFETIDSTSVRSGEKEIGRLKSGKRVWAYKKQRSWYLIHIPWTKTRGWVSSKSLRLINSFAEEEQANLDSAFEFQESADKLLRQNQFQRAANDYQKSIDLLAPIIGSPSTMAYLYSQMAHCLASAEQKSDKVGEFYERALRIQQGVKGKLTGEDAKLLSNYGYSLAKQGKFKEGIAVAKRALDIVSQEEGVDSKTSIQIQTNIGDMEAAINMPEAKDTYVKALGYLRKLQSPGTETSAALLASLSTWYLRNKELNKALDLARELVEISGNEKIATPQSVDAYLVIARVLSEQGKFLESRQYLEKGLAASNSLYGQSHSKTAAFLNNLGTNFVALDQHDVAIGLFGSALEIQLEKLGSHSDTASSAHWLAFCIDIVQSGENEPDKELVRAAMFALGKAIEIYDELNNPQQAIASMLRKVDLHFTIGEKKKGLELIELTQEYADKKLPNDMWTLGRIATVHSSNVIEDDRKEGIRLQREAIKAYRKYYSNDLDVAKNLSLVGFASALYQNKELNEAAYWQGLNHRIEREQTKAFLGLPSAELQSKFEELYRSLYLTLLMNHSAGNVEQCFDVIENHKGLYFENQSVVERLLKSAKSEKDREPLVKLSRIRSEIAALSLKTNSLGSDDKQRLIDLQSESYELFREAKYFVNKFKLQMQTPPVSVSKVVKKLDDDEALVSFFRLPFSYENALTENHLGEGYLVFVITKNNPVAMLEIGTADKIDQQIVQLRTDMGLEQEDLMSDYLKDPGGINSTLQKKSRELSKVIFEPLLPHLNGIKKLNLCPDGQLWTLPWEALALKSGGYAIEHYQFQYSVSARHFKVALTSDVEPTGPVVFADPAFGAEVDRNNLQEQQLNRRDARGLPAEVKRLPWTREEGKYVAKQIRNSKDGDVKLFIDELATESQFKSLKSPKILVAATHGYFVPSESYESADNDFVRRDPLLNCGLILAGYNSRNKLSSNMDDGILSGLEIAATDLRSTNLVVLSACESGLGQVMAGEGVSSLNHAFQLAGAKAVISSLWSVSDRDTTRLMADFFKIRTKSGNTANSLHQAKLRYIKRLRERNGVAHPYFWAAFTLTGQD